MKVLLTLFALTLMCGLTTQAQNVSSGNALVEASALQVPSLSPVLARADTFANDRDLVSDNRQKKPAIALGLSVLVPGAGQIYNGQVAKGLTIAGLFYGGVAMVTLADITRAHKSITAYGWMCVVTIVGSHVWGMVDAVTTADRLSEETVSPGHAAEMTIGDHRVSLDGAILPHVAVVRIELGI